MHESTTIRWERADDGVIHLIVDDPTQSANTMNAAFTESLTATVDRLVAERETVSGVILRSAKRTFFAGGDLNDLQRATKDDLGAIESHVSQVKRDLRRLERLGVPVVSAIHGTALGGGLELVLATHRRIVVDDPKIQLGLPEVSLGLLPGGGGVTRVTRLMGITDGLSQVLLESPRLTPAEAHRLGLIDELVASADALIPAAEQWIHDHPEALQPWDRPGYRIPGGAPSDPAVAAVLPMLPAALRRRLGGTNYPAPIRTMAAAVEGAQVDFDTALEIESRYFIELVTGQVSKNMIQAFFFDMQQVKGLRGRDSQRKPWKPAKVVILGAGMMGAGIAYVCARAGIDVVLKDVAIEAADRGKGYSQRLVDRAVTRGRMSEADAAALLARIAPTTDPATAQGADLVIEAVFEDPAVKAAAMREIEPFLSPDALLASNTSTLPIGGLAGAVSRPADFVGLHFFSPVDRMPLLEIVKGTETSDATVSRALDVAKLIGKTPIVVNDSRGFFTSRVISTVLDEALAMLADGIPAPSIEQAGRQAGYPVPVLQLFDELTLTLSQKIRWAEKAAVEAEGGIFPELPSHVVMDRMIDEFGRPGRSGGAGFYDYDADGKRTGLWPGLQEAFGGDDRSVPLEDLKQRLLFREALEAVHCRDEGVVESAADANVGSILGIGFPGWTGGVLQYIAGYVDPADPEQRTTGTAGFVERARELAERYGERFEPPASLVAAASDPQRGSASAEARGPAVSG